MFYKIIMKTDQRHFIFAMNIILGLRERNLMRQENKSLNFPKSNDGFSISN